jgi:hypothetical protein
MISGCLPPVATIVGGRPAGGHGRNNALISDIQGGFV